MARSNSGKKEVKAKLSGGGALMVALIAALGGTAGSWLSGKQLVESARIPAQISARTTCIAKVDSSESNFKDKSSQFITSVATFRSDLVLMNSANKNMLRDPAITVSQNGYGLIPYASPELASLSKSISNSVRSIAENPGYASSKDIKNIDSSLDEWLPASSGFLKMFDKKRADCK